jgi:hypothetical protein
MVSSKGKVIRILLIEVFVLQVVIMAFTPTTNAYDEVDFYVRSINAPTHDYWDSYGMGLLACIGGSSWNKVADRSCHAHCISKHANSLYIMSNIWYSPRIWAQVGWMWDKNWSNPLWYAARLNRNNMLDFHLFTENINPGIPCILKLQWVRGTSDKQWRFYRYSDVSSGEICRLAGVDLTWGGLQGAGEKWYWSETNWSNFWGMQQRGEGYGHYTDFHDTNATAGYEDSDAIFNFVPVSRNAFNIRN